MGQYIVEVSNEAREHLRAIHKSGNKPLIRKVEQLFKELSEHLYSGTG